MLSPEQIERAGDIVAECYSQIEAEMVAHLARVMASGGEAGQRSMTSIVALATSAAPELREILRANAATVSASVREAVEWALGASLADDARRIGAAARLAPRYVESTAQGVAEILARDNLAMLEGARQAFIRASAKAVTMTNSGLFTDEQAIHSAVRALGAEGVPIITYRNAETGRVTVRNRVDVAVRRHVRTQIAQDGARMSADLMRENGVPLVEVSSHADARPEHAAWQGQVYGLDGPVEVGGVKYKGLAEATGYGTVAGLLGANCRHSFGPWLPGTPRAYSPNPEHQSGLPGEEVYEAEQRQRKAERDIRAAKREVMACRAAGLDDSEAKAKLREKQATMRELIKEENAKSKTGAPVLVRNSRREWAGDMPKRSSMARKPVDPIAQRRTGMRPASQQLLSGAVSYLKKNGCAVIIGGEGAEKLLSPNVDALYIVGGKVVVWRDNPTTSEVLEESYHFAQDMRGVYADQPEDLMTSMREIDAQKWLISVERKYNIPRSETEQTRRALEYYEEHLRELKGGLPDGGR